MRSNILVTIVVIGATMLVYVPRLIALYSHIWLTLSK